MLSKLLVNFIAFDIRFKIIRSIILLSIDIIISSSSVSKVIAMLCSLAKSIVERVVFSTTSTILSIAKLGAKNPDSIFALSMILFISFKSLLELFSI